MAKLLGLDKVATFFRIIRDNGGIFGSIKTLFRLLLRYSISTI